MQKLWWTVAPGLITVLFWHLLGMPGYVLLLRGSFVNFSYRGAPDIDYLKVEQLARQQHFEILEHGARPFRI